MRKLLDKIYNFIMKHVDKLLHFLVNYFIITAFSVINFWIGFFICIIASVGKEIYDAKSDSDCFSWGDILADILGILFGIYILNLM